MRTSIGAVVIALAAGSVAALQDGGDAVPAPGSRSPWAERLAALDPQRPMAYFELAEEVADAGGERDLAWRLFALAGAIDPRRLGRSSALALADLETDERARQRLRALAWLLAEGKGGAAGIEQPGAAPAAPPEPVAIEAVTDAFSHYRMGHGNRAVAALERPGAMALLESIGPLLVGGLDRFLEDCRVYRSGEIAPRLSAQEVTHMLELESALLAGADSTWSGDLLLHGNEPLIEVDPARLAEAFGVDASRPVWRNGRWVDA